MRVFGVADGAGVGVDLVVPRAAGHRPARQGMAWPVAAAWMGRARTVATLSRQAAYPCGLGSVG
jgi:hypothetical protein